MNRQFVRLFLSIALVIIAALVTQIFCVTIFARQVVSLWSESVLDEFAGKIEDHMAEMEDNPSNVILQILSGSTNERISGFIIRSSNGQIITFGHSGRGVPVPQLNSFSEDSFSFLDSTSRTERRSGTNTISIPAPKYRLDITTKNPFTLEADSVSFGETNSKGDVTVSYPDVIDKTDIAGTIAIYVNSEIYAYLDVLVYSVKYYSPTRFLLAEFYKALSKMIPFVLLCSLVLALFISRKTDRNVKSIVKGLQELSKGRYNVEVETSNIKEYKEIAASISKLGDDLKRHSASRKEWIRNISHDLNTPVTSMNMLLEGAEDGLFPLTPELISSLKKENDTLKSRIASVSYYSYLLSPDAKCEKVESSLMDLADMVLQPLGKNVHLAFGMVEEVYGDINLLYRGLTEVVKNAFEYGSSSDTPVWSAAIDAESDMLVLTITNGGKLPDPRPQFFEPWARGDASRTSGGSGLGLPIAYQIMALHGGSIQIDEVDGKVLVTIRLPRKPQ